MRAWQFGLPPGFPQRAGPENCRPGRAARVRNSAGKPTELRELRVSTPDSGLLACHAVVTYARIVGG